MKKRKQFTFYRSFWDALQDQSETDRLPILEAIILYALDGKEPKGLKNNVASFFKLCRPTLDASWKKAAAGKKGGSKPKAKRKQNESKKENEIENKIENEIENEDDCLLGEGFEKFWQLYPRKEGKLKAKQAYIGCAMEADKILDGLRRQLSCDQWKRDNGRFVPLPATWLNQRRWEDEGSAPPEPTARRPDAEEILAVRRLMESEY